MTRKAKKVNKTNKKVVKHKTPIRKKASVHKKPMLKTISSTVISTVPLDTPIIPPMPPIIVKNDGESWNAIRKICESGIAFYRDYHEVKSCDTELARKLNEIQEVAINNNLLHHINFILRSKQTLIDKLKQLHRYSSKKSI